MRKNGRNTMFSTLANSMTSEDGSRIAHCKERKTGRNFNLDGPRAFAKRCHRVDIVIFFFYFLCRDSQNSFKS